MVCDAVYWFVDLCSVVSLTHPSPAMLPVTASQTPDSRGCLLELTWKGEKPITLNSGESRIFLKDYDSIIMRGWCEKEGVRVGFGSCAGMVLPATPLPAA